ncbi:hypothetical protein HanXRQr2_Chr12g0528941 [Helianthus annuus]|uniref:Transmembrane protein n=1 Tax=Helianthus annuus TaxID=4232 RepID=A0A9K3HEW7_HELAN|nr:hypothetical protein HanXRQr2_Chr12g0528941 [Helianthus annuus]KAJ0861699.1 hypothetical protein HanPSC8_Chr12g0509621 [Helianthus annuus]
MIGETMAYWNGGGVEVTVVVMVRWWWKMKQRERGEKRGLCVCV